MLNVFDVTEFGAVADGKTNCTLAIQNTLDEAAKVGGTVIVPPGRYSCGYLKLAKGVRFEGFYSHDFRSVGGSILVLNDENAPCMLDITDAQGCSIFGIALHGEGLGKNIHGISISRENATDGGAEDTSKIDYCYVTKFTGNGINIDSGWCFSVRHCHLMQNDGSGLYLNGFDAFISDNWFSINGEAGIKGGKSFSSVMITANRIEWNKKAGVMFSCIAHVNITGNSFDRSQGPAIKITDDGDYRLDVNVTGNIFNRSGRPQDEPFLDEYESSHLYIKNTMNLLVVGNTFRAGIDDNGIGNLSPNYGVVIKTLKAAIIKDNVMEGGSIKQQIVDLGDHENDVIIKDNIGNLTSGNFKYSHLFDREKQKLGAE